MEHCTLLILPTTHRVEQELLDRARKLQQPLAAVSGEDVMSLEDFIQEVFQHAREVALQRDPDGPWRNRRVASEREVELVVRQVIRALYQSGQGIFARFASRGGFVQALIEFFADCRAGHVSSDDLFAFHDELAAREGEDAVPDRRLRRVQELAELFERYNRTLETLGLLDPGQTYAVALEHLRDLSAPLPDVTDYDQIEVREVYDWAPIHIDIMHALGRRLAMEDGGYGDRVVLFLPYDIDRPSLFHALEGTLRHLESLGGESLMLEWNVGENVEAASPLQDLTETLWVDQTPGLVDDEEEYSGPRVEGLADHLVVLEAPGVRREARAVARRIRNLLDGGAAPEDIAIAVRTMDESVDLIGDALEAYGISWSHAFEEPLGATPLAQTVLQVLNLVQQNFPRELFIEVLTGWATAHFFPEQTQLHNVARDAVERAGRERLVFNHELALVLRSLGIRDDRPSRVALESGYEERLDQYVERQRLIVDEDRQKRAKDHLLTPEDEIPIDDTERVQYALLIRNRVVNFRHTLAKYIRDEARTLNEHARDLRNLLDVLDIRGAVASVPALTHTLSALDEQSDSGTHGMVEALDRQLIRAVARDLQALSILDRILFELEHYPAQDSVRLTLEDFHDLLLNLFNKETWSSAVDQTGGCVRLLSVTDLCGLRIPHLIIVGLNDGKFPGASTSRPLFTDEDRYQYASFDRARRRPLGDDTYRIPFKLHIPWDEDIQFSDALAPIPAKLAEDALLFFFSIQAASSSLTMTCSTLDSVGRKAVRSIFVDAVVQLIPEDEHDEILSQELLLPIPHLEACVAPWELVCRHALDSMESGRALHVLEPDYTFQPDSIQQRFAQAHIPVDNIDLCSSIELVRSHLGTLDPEPLQKTLSESPFAAWSGLLDRAHRSFLEDTLPFGIEDPLSHVHMDGFRKCPQQFFFRNVLHLRRDLKRGLEVSNLDHSILVHDVIEKTLRELEHRSLLQLEPTDKGMRRIAETVAGEIIDEQLDRWEERRNLAHPQLWAKERRNARRQIVALIHRILSTHDSQQLAAPWGFGSPRWTSKVDTEAVPLELDQGRSVSIAGAVDRVVLKKQGEHTVLELLDYGTASAQTLRRYEKRDLVTSYALPMAMLAAIHGLVPRLRDEGRIPDQIVVVAQRESVMDGKRTRPLKAIVKTDTGGAPEIRSKGLEQATRNMDHSIQGMWNGHFPFDTKDCSHCAFKRACRRGNYPEL